MRKSLWAAALLVCAACGGGRSSPVSVNGNIAGQPMGAQDAVSNVFASGADSAALILFTNTANTCAKLSANQQPKNAKAIILTVGTQNATNISAPTAPGTYTVHDFATVKNVTGNVAVAQYAATDATCTPIADADSASGTVTLTRVDSTGYAGSFDITFSDGSHITGSFTANRCAALSDTIAGTCT